ncbi:hypothetical protein POM88_053841 [Heracleum sosnowskyi]|uniref:Chaoptin n=1 Tax=Heracleum sosnowskyi TaxID=360622 RepID=A0AAD8LVE1_9APIA|nr:hypothetical protein POM88_053841 [Heracleum sosnowskyi]
MYIYRNIRLNHTKFRFYTSVAGIEPAEEEGCGGSLAARRWRPEPGGSGCGDRGGGWQRRTERKTRHRGGGRVHWPESTEKRRRVATGAQPRRREEEQRGVDARGKENQGGSIGNLSNLHYLSLRSNDFRGLIPKFIGSLNSLRYLDLSDNSFEGPIPHELGNLSQLRSLKVVDFSFNNLTGSLPHFTLLSSLTELVVKFNQLDGYLPTVFEKHSALQILDLSNNHLKGSVPDFTGLSSLESLDLHNNEFFWESS